jgi:hypothetical protein
MRFVLLLATLLSTSALAAPAPAPAPSTPQPRGETWGAPWSSILGSWTGEGQGKPGQGGGSFTFGFELDKKILVRRSTADYPAAEGRPAVHHEDLIVIYPEGTADAKRAIYFDNEGHVIEYQVGWSGDGKALTFVSPTRAGAPTFRLTYRANESDGFNVTFEMAPAGSTVFNPYVSGVVRRTGGGS